MAANKKAKQIIETLNLDGELLNCVSYATYYNRIPLFTSFRVENNGEQALENLTIQVAGANKLILPAEIEIAEIPAESSMEVKTPSLLNPKYLAEIENPEDCAITVTVCSGRTVVCSIEASIEIKKKNVIVHHVDGKKSLTFLYNKNCELTVEQIAEYLNNVLVKPIAQPEVNGLSETATAEADPFEEFNIAAANTDATDTKALDESFDDGLDNGEDNEDNN